MFILAAQKAAESDLVSWVFNVIRWMTGWLVNLIYGAVGTIFRLIFTLSEVTAGPDLLGDVYTRIYVILGIFMVFKLSFSFINYILNPDALTDKQQGVGKILINTVIMLGALAFIPTFVFGSDGIMIRAQKALLPMVPKIVMGIQPGTGAAFNASTDPETLEEYGDSMAAAALSAFFTPIEGGNCNGKALTTVADFWPSIDDTCRIDGVKYYVYRYDGVFALLVGCVLIYVLLGIAIEVGKRVFRLLILQVIAPIPIMTLIDPKGTKGATFSSWLKMTINTFLDIFIKLAVLYFVIMMIGMLTNNTGEGIFGEIDGVVFAFLMVVLLLFAKEAPKFVTKALGMKDAGGGDFFGLKGVGAVAGLGVAAASTVSSAAGGGAVGNQVQKGLDWVRGGINNFKASHPNIAKGLDIAGGVAGGTADVAASLGRAGMTVAQGKGYRDIVGAASTSGMRNSKIDKLSAANNAYDSMLKTFDKEAAKKGVSVSSYSYKDSTGSHTVNFTGGGITFTQYEDALQNARSRGNSSFSVGGATFYTANQARDEKAIKAAQYTEYMDQVKSGALELSPEAKYARDNYVSSARAAGAGAIDQNSYSSLDKSNSALKDRRFNEMGKAGGSYKARK